MRLDDLLMKSGVRLLCHKSQNQLVTYMVHANGEQFAQTLVFNKKHLVNKSSSSVCNIIKKELFEEMNGLFYKK